MNNSAFRVRLTLVWAAGMALELLACILAADGILIYPMDDTYIHLSIAENIPRGQWGVNLSEPASASSSILYPLVLALTQMAGLGAAGPLALSLPTTALSVWIFAGLVCEWTGRDMLRWGLGLTGLLLLNTFSLPMVAMEHSQHVLLMLIAFVALIRLTENRQVTAGMWLAVILLPLIRFEGLAMAGLLILAQVYYGHWRGPLAQGAIIIACLAAYVTLMLSLGLPALPSSVLMKSGATASAMDGGWADSLAKLMLAFDLTGETIPDTTIRVLILANVLAWAMFGRDRGRGTLVVLLVVSGTLAAHIIAGGTSYFPRREVYAVVIGGLGLVHQALPLLSADSALRRSFVPIALTLCAIVNIQVTLVTPLASRNIYQQQYQMHRFATEFWHAPIAVNDLGLPAYQNDEYVLDLLGLGSETVRRITQAGSLKAADLARLTTEKNVEMVIVYEPVFRDRPDDWQEIARLTTSQVSSFGATVSFFAIGDDAAARALPLLEAFRETLPDGASLALRNEPSS